MIEKLNRVEADQINLLRVGLSLMDSHCQTKQNAGDNSAMRRRVGEIGRYLKLEVLLSENYS